MFNPRERSQPITLVAFLFIACLLLCGIASAAPSITLSKKSGPPTTRLRVSGRGFKHEVIVDIYFDKTYLSRSVTDKEGDFPRILIRVPRGALPGNHTISAVEADNGSRATQKFLVQTDWRQSQFNSHHTGENPYENVLSPKTVGGLTPKWNLPSASSFGAPAVADGIVYVGAEPGSQDWNPFYRLDAEMGTPLGFFIAGGYYYAPAAAHGLLYISTNGAAVYALDAHTGDLVWSFRVSGVNTAELSDLTIAEDMIYFGLTEPSTCTVNALDARTGLKVWSYFVDRNHCASPVTVAEGVAYFGFSNQVDALDARTGRFLWSFTAGGNTAGYPTVVRNVAYFSADDGYVYAVNASTGALIWKSGAGMPYAPLAVAKGRVYVHSYDGNLYSFDARTGKLVWSYATSACNCYQFPPAVANGVVYFAADYTVYALDAQDGILLWSYDTGGVYSPPVVVNGVLYVGTEVSGLWAFGLKGRGSAETDSPKAPSAGVVQLDRGASGSPSMAGRGHETVIYSFRGAAFYCGDGENPYAGLVFDSAGLLHGTTLLGLPNCGYSEEGSVFTVSTSGQETVGYFPDDVPYGGVALDKAGNVYVTSYYGKSNETSGAVVKNRATLYAFSGGSDGGNPEAGVVLDEKNLYGTTVYGGQKCHGPEYCGVVFQVSSTTQKETVLHTFTGGSDGRNPTSSLIFDQAGNLYGTTLLGGEKDSGVVFELFPSDSGWTEKVLHAFTVRDGKYPHSPVVLDAAGHLYGTTEFGGAHDKGVVFELTPNPDGTWTESVLHSFSGKMDGAYPFAGLILDPEGKLYGTTVGGGTGQGVYGTVFELTPNPNGGWTEILLHSFGAGSDGAFPYAPLVRDAAGNLYGTTSEGGTYSGGVVFQVSP